MILTIDNDNFPKQHQECGHCYGILCSVWGTNWIYIQDSKWNATVPSFCIAELCVTAYNKTCLCMYVKCPTFLSSFNQFWIFL